MKSLLAFSLIIIISFIKLQAQIVHNFAIEGGMGITQFSDHWSYESSSIYSSTSEDISNYSHPSPVFGLAATAIVYSRFVFSAALQYRGINNAYHIHWEAVYPSRPYSSITDEFHSERYDKFCLPITVGYQFGKKIHPTIFLGVEPNYIFNGNFSYSYVGMEDSLGVNLWTGNIENPFININPFDADQFQNTAKHLNIQLTFGFAISFMRRFQFVWSQHYGTHINHPPVPPNAEEEYVIYDRLMHNTDGTFTLRCYLKDLYPHTKRRIQQSN